MFAAKGLRMVSILKYVFAAHTLPRVSAHLCQSNGGQKRTRLTCLMFAESFHFLEIFAPQKKEGFLFFLVQLTLPIRSRFAP